jgi:hypothetical protein
MGTNDSDDSDVLKQCQYLWEEYKYRHDLIWQRIFRFTTARVSEFCVSGIHTIKL